MREARRSDPSGLAFCGRHIDALRRADLMGPAKYEGPVKAEPADGRAAGPGRPRMGSHRAGAARARPGLRRTDAAPRYLRPAANG